MVNLHHVVLKDHENSDYVWHEFFCPTCLEKWVTKSNHLESLYHTMANPQYLSRVYPPLVNEPNCRECGVIFTQ